jgi:hypothetical protein
MNAELRRAVEWATENSSEDGDPSYSIIEKSYMCRLAAVVYLVDKLEWSGVMRGQGSGFMSSGGDGPLVSACPMCGGINPQDQYKNDFNEESWGHRKRCALDAALNGGRENGDRQV